MNERFPLGVDDDIVRRIWFWQSNRYLEEGWTLNYTNWWDWIRPVAVTSAPGTVEFSVGAKDGFGFTRFRTKEE